jgi:hypothetical protein
VRVVLLCRDLITASRVEGILGPTDADLRLIQDPADLPRAGSVGLLLVNWDDREGSWGNELGEWRRAAGSSTPRVILFGPHADLSAHAEARAAGLGPMWARSRLFARLADELR